MTRRVKLPIDVDGTPLAELSVERDEIAVVYGEPELRAERMREGLGVIEAWPLRLKTGQLVLLEYYVEKKLTLLYANPPHVGQALRELSITEEQVLWTAEAND